MLLTTEQRDPGDPAASHAACAENAGARQDAPHPAGTTIAIADQRLPRPPWNPWETIARKSPRLP